MAVRRAVARPGALPPWHRGAAVAHAQDPRVMATVEQPEALPSRLDGDPWTDMLVEAKP
jgi:hypothetical protein